MDLLNTASNERIDLADFTYATQDSQLAMQRELVSNLLVNPTGQQNWIISGFVASILGGSPNVVTVSLGSALLAYREGVNVNYGVVSADGSATNTVDLTSFTAGTYGIWVRFNYIASSYANRIFWSPSAGGSEYAQSTPTRLGANWELRVEVTNPGSEWLQIAQVVLPTGWPTTQPMVITDMRPLYYEGRVDLLDNTSTVSFNGIAYTTTAITNLGTVVGLANGVYVTGANIPNTTTSITSVTAGGVASCGITASSTAITSLPSYAVPGMAVSGTGIPTGAYLVTAVGGGSGTLSANATSTTTSSVTFAATLTLNAAITVLASSQPYVGNVNPTGTNFPQVWGTGTNDRNANRATYGIRDLHTFVDAMKQCIEDVKGPNLVRWWQNYVGGQTIGYAGTAILGRTTWTDANFYAQGSTTVPALGFGGTSNGTLQYTRSSNAWQWVLGGNTIATLNSGGLNLYGGTTSSTNPISANYQASNTNVFLSAFKGTSGTSGLSIGYGTTSGSNGLAFLVTTASGGTVSTTTAYYTGGVLQQGTSDSLFFEINGSVEGYLNSSGQWWLGNFAVVSPGITAGILNVQNANQTYTATFGVNTNAHNDNLVGLYAYTTNKNSLQFWYGVNGATWTQSFAVQSTSSTQFQLYDAVNSIALLNYTTSSKTVDFSAAVGGVNAYSLNLSQVANNLVVTTSSYFFSCMHGNILDAIITSGATLTGGTNPGIAITATSATITIPVRGFTGTAQDVYIAYSNTSATTASWSAAMYYRWTGFNTNISANVLLFYSGGGSFTASTGTAGSPIGSSVGGGGGNVPTNLGSQGPGIMCWIVITITGAPTSGLTLYDVSVPITASNLPCQIAA